MISMERLGVVLAPEHEWQAKFNPGMVEVDGKVHLLYRFCEKKSEWHNQAIDWSQLKNQTPYAKNQIGYAELTPNGMLVCEAREPVIYPERPYELAGCEDPRIIFFEGAYYIFYSAWDIAKVRVGVARTTDFVRYEKIGVIDNFTWDKDAFIFPERINGKIPYVHRIPPHIQIDYFSSFEEMFAPESWAGYEERVEEQTVLRGRYDYEIKKVGGGVPPMKTEDGWLFIYHGVDQNNIYHGAAALLDLNRPSEVIARLPYPLLSPETEFEKAGDYNGCVFPVGAYVCGDELYISYGAADKYTALAKVKLERLLGELRKYRE